MLLVDPAISKLKFDREVALYKESEDTYLRRGCWVLKAEFPQILVAFATPQLRFPMVVFGVIIEFTNYDLWPPSVKFVNPFTLEPYRGRDLPTILKRRVLTQIPGIGQGHTEVGMLQFHDPDDIPFLCLQGVREYHDHPAHSGDSWLLHRGSGEGTLIYIMETLNKYGVQPINGYNIGHSILGFTQQPAPE